MDQAISGPGKKKNPAAAGRRGRANPAIAGPSGHWSAIIGKASDHWGRVTAGVPDFNSSPAAGTQRSQGFPNPSKSRVQRGPVLTVFLMLVKMVKVKKTYKARFVVDFSELGESDPLLLNATLFHELQNMPWYPSGILKGEGATYFSKKIEVPDGQTLDIIALDTVLLQLLRFYLNPAVYLTCLSRENQSSVRGNDQIVWLMRILNESISDWKVVVGLHQLISSDCNIWETNETRFAPLQNILLQYGVDVYMSTETCDDNTTTTTTTRGNGNEAIYLTAVNHNLGNDGRVSSPSGELVGNGEC
ncbi:hypothetical protein C2S52_010558 [Perilla frutescens var. hirtella]|nr:hypothetical protein C2S52_010558 [Perilla frutescens var. hirtella]